MVAVVLESDLRLWVLRCSERESVYFPAVLVRLSAECLRANWNFSTPPLWPPNVKRWLIGKDPDAEQDWGQEKRGWQRVRWLDASPSQWTWIWANSKRQWRVGEPGLLSSMGSQRVRHDLATEQQLHHQLCAALCLPFLYCWQFLCKPRALFLQTA